MDRFSGSLFAKFKIMELFRQKDSLSPKEAWKNKHVLRVTPTGQEFKVQTPSGEIIGRGDTEGEALIDWAEKAGVPCWKGEILNKYRQNNE